MMRELSVHGCFDFRFYASSIKPGRAWLCIMPRQFDNMPPVYLAMCQCIDNLEGIPASFDR